MKSLSRKIKYEYVYNYILSKDCILLSDNINNAKEKLKIKCSCGEIFYRSFNKFKSSNQTKCLKCQNITEWNYNKVKEFVTDNNCKLLSSHYDNREEILDFVCSCGEKFSTTFHSFLYSGKRQCDDCGNILRANKIKKGIDYLKKIVSESSTSILISNDYKDYYEKLDFKCGCGNVFTTCFLSFLNGKRLCDTCSKNSKMENIVEQFLIKNNIHYNKQVSFENLKGINGGLLKFDFSINDINGNILFVLELDGEQHFKPIKHFGGEEKFIIQQKHDKLKNTYCKNNNIILIRIPYYQKDNLYAIMSNLIYKYANPVPSLKN